MYYRHTPLSCAGHNVVGIHIFVETHRRVFGNKFGRMPEPLKDDCFSMGGYCIDAPDLLPGGSCYFNEFAPPDEPGQPNDNWVVNQTIIEREP